MYDQVSLDGAFSKSGAAFASKSLVLTKNAEGKFVGNAIVMPTDTEASNLSLTYSVNGTDYTSTPAGRIAANGQYELATTVEAGSSSSKVNLNSAITYAAWDSTVVNLSDSFTIDLNAGGMPESEGDYDHWFYSANSTTLFLYDGTFTLQPSSDCLLYTSDAADEL